MVSLEFSVHGEISVMPLVSFLFCGFYTVLFFGSTIEKLQDAEPEWRVSEESRTPS